MRRGPCAKWTVVVLAIGLGHGLLGTPAWGQGGRDEPRGLGRLFRLGNRGAAPAPPEPARSRQRPGSPAGSPADVGRLDDVGAPPPAFPRARPGEVPGAPGSSLPPYVATTPGTSPYGTALNPYGRMPANPPATFEPTPPATPDLPGTAGPRLVPQPRQSRPVTEAPPILTRVQLGRSDDGRTFAMFLQIHADGTVIDTEGVHKVGRDVMQPLIEALRSADVGRIRGHCGGPPVDYVEQVLLTVYDQTRGRLQANTFSFSGNPQGCNPAIRQLQAAIDAVQAKISPAPAPAPAASNSDDDGLTPPLGPPATPEPSPSTITLTPID
jgi:hypothetical protein